MSIATKLLPALPTDSGAEPGDRASCVSTPPPPAISPYPVRRFTVAEYRRMGEIGVLTEDDRVELLEGWIVPKMNHNPRHDTSVSLTDRALSVAVPLSWFIRVQSAVDTVDSQPEPDHAVVRGPERRYSDCHPAVADIGLLVEVAESSLRRDRDKCVTYARARIPIYWIVNLLHRQVEVYKDPSGPADDPYYANRVDYKPGDEIPVVLDGVEVGRVRVDDLLP